MKEVKNEYVNLDEEQESLDELIEKYEQREAEMEEDYSDLLITEEDMDKIEEQIFPRRQITVKLFPNTHKKLKMIATSKDTTLEKVATSIVEDKIYDVDIVKYVADEIKNAEEIEALTGGKLYGDPDYLYSGIEDSHKRIYDENDKILKKGNPRKRINVKVYQQSHLKLKIMAAIQDRSLNNLVSSIIEDEIGEKNEFDADKLLDEVMDYEIKNSYR